MKEKGQALIIVIVVIAVVASVLTLSILAVINSSKNSARNVLARKALNAAESGAEYAMLKILRNPLSCSGTETFNQDSSTIEITYNQSTSDCIILSKATEKNIVKKVQVQANYDVNLKFNFCCYRQVP